MYIHMFSVLLFVPRFNRKSGSEKGDLQSLLRASEDWKAPPSNTLEVGLDLNDGSVGDVGWCGCLGALGAFRVMSLNTVCLFFGPICCCDCLKLLAPSYGNIPESTGCCNGIGTSR